MALPTEADQPLVDEGLYPVDVTYIGFGMTSENIKGDHVQGAS
jgi:hypothetical protein